MYAFDYAKPASLDEAARLLADDPEAKALAGGQTYIPTLKQRLAQPTRLVDLAGIPDLATIKEEGDGLAVGAMTTHKAVAASPVVQRAFPELAYLASLIGDPAVRAMGTIGGSVANNDPAADYPVVVLTLDATVRTTKGEHRGSDFFPGMFETALEPDELIREFHIPVPEAAAWEKFRNPASRYALVSVLLVRTKDGEIRCGVGGAGPTCFRATAIEDALRSSFAPEALDGVTIDAGDLNEDIHATAAYRAHLIPVLAKRCVRRMLRR
ncbi:MAG: xanthine dehydrogenase family protein subunit M [Geminicoccaceae bacterium]|nr:xanthine dehydrogenase family protein subunit M [Geminicoccaceae bacterium]